MFPLPLILLTLYTRSVVRCNKSSIICCGTKCSPTSCKTNSLVHVRLLGLPAPVRGKLKCIMWSSQLGPGMDRWWSSWRSGRRHTKGSIHCISTVLLQTPVSGMVWSLSYTFPPSLVLPVHSLTWYTRRNFHLTSSTGIYGPNLTLLCTNLMKLGIECIMKCKHRNN